MIYGRIFKKMSRLTPELHPSLNEDVLKILFIKKIFTTIDFIESDIKFLSQSTFLPYKDILQIREDFIKKNGGEVVSGAELYANLIKNSKPLPTLIKSLDEILNGGLVGDQIYEFCGYPSSGKTQICLTLAANFVQHHKKSVLYIDTKRDFSGKRLQEILNSRNCDEETSAKICSEIKIKQISNRFQLISVLDEVSNQASDISGVDLIIVDSLPAIFYHTGDFNNTLTFLNSFVNVMRFLNKRRICFILTNILLKNQNMSNENPNTVNEKPGLGTYWLSIPHIRFKITKVEDQCQIDIMKSVNLPQKSCRVQITNQGVS